MFTPTPIPASESLTKTCRNSKTWQPSSNLSITASVAFRVAVPSSHDLVSGINKVSHLYENATLYCFRMRALIFAIRAAGVKLLRACNNDLCSCSWRANGICALLAVLGIVFWSLPASTSANCHTQVFVLQPFAAAAVPEGGLHLGCWRLRAAGSTAARLDDSVGQYASAGFSEGIVMSPVRRIAGAARCPGRSHRAGSGSEETRSRLCRLCLANRIGILRT